MNEKKKYSAVLIDDDPLVRLSWKVLAQAKAKDFISFAHPKEFMLKVNEIHLDTPIYLDSNLQDGLRGEQVAVELHQLGFTELYVATGYDRSQLGNLPNWIRGVVGKEPPWLS